MFFSGFLKKSFEVSWQYIENLKFKTKKDDIFLVWLWGQWGGRTKDEEKYEMRKGVMIIFCFQVIIV